MILISEQTPSSLQLPSIPYRANNLHPPHRVCLQCSRNMPPSMVFVLTVLSSSTKALSPCFHTSLCWTVIFLVRISLLTLLPYLAPFLVYFFSQYLLIDWFLCCYLFKYVLNRWINLKNRDMSQQCEVSKQILCIIIKDLCNRSVYISTMLIDNINWKKFWHRN